MTGQSTLDLARSEETEDQLLTSVAEVAAQWADAADGVKAGKLREHVHEAGAVRRRGERPPPRRAAAAFCSMARGEPLRDAHCTLQHEREGRRR